MDIKVVKLGSISKQQVKTDKQTKFLNLDDVTKSKGIERVQAAIEQDGHALVTKKAGKQLGRLLSAAGFASTVTKVREKGYWQEVVWQDEQGNALEIEYDVPLYTNARGYEVKGRRVTATS